MPRIRVATWNLMWAKPNSVRGQECLNRLMALDADIVCLTEAFEDSLKPLNGYLASSHPNTGYPIHPGRRKVVIWSRWPLENIDEVGSSDLPTGRYVSASFNCSKRIELIGVCIPWKAAHVSTGRKNRNWWEDHIRYLSELHNIERFNRENYPTIVLGDFNQRMSGKYARKDVHEQLNTTFKSLEIPTSDLQDTDGKSAIDHIAVRGQNKVMKTGIISRLQGNGSGLSDHFGVWCDLDF